MSQVLEIDGLLESPLSDLHAIAGELNIEGYRLLKKPDLTIAILESRGLVADEIRASVETKAVELAKLKEERERAIAEAEEAERAEREAAREAQASERARGGAARDRSARGGRQGRGRRGGAGAAKGERAPRERGARSAESGAAGGGRRQQGESSGEQGKAPVATQPLAGVFEPGSGGGGRLRTDLTRRVRADADVPRGEVRRWQLKRGDLINAQVKKARRGRTDFVVSSIDDVNGLTQEARKQPPPGFEARAAAPVSGRYAKRTFKHAPTGAGSRLVITGPTRAAASAMLAKLAGELAGAGVVTTLVVVSARPEQSTSVAGVEVISGDATRPAGDIVPALELALERDKRLAEGGRETALLVDGLDLLEDTKSAEILAQAKNLQDGGSLTIAASAGAGSSLEALATAIAVVAAGRKLKLDKKASWAG